MKKLFIRGFIAFIVLMTTFSSAKVPITQAQSQINWWNEAWPYRVAVQVSESGPAAAHLDFTQLFEDLGLVDAILDLSSVRVIPVISGESGEPIPYQESYSTLLIDGESLNTDPSTDSPYWNTFVDIDLSLDDSKFTQGSHAVQSTLDLSYVDNFQISFSYNFNGSPVSDWSQYEVLTYDLWPEVNHSALDQAPDLFRFDLLGIRECITSDINGPAMALDQWNKASVSLTPYGECVAPDLSALTGFKFSFLMDFYEPEHYYYEAGDQVTLWLDNFRLVDQNGDGEIRWIAEPGVNTYDIYFDTLNHTGHNSPTLSDIPETDNTAHIAGLPEAGGYFHQITGAEPAGLTLWSAPITEKILKEQKTPGTQNTLTITAAKGEYEALQLVVNSPITTDLPVSVSDLIHETDIIPTSAIQIFRVDYVRLTSLSDEYGRLTDWPDPLYPILQSEKVHFPAQENQPLWFRVKIPAGVAAGDYSGEITIGQASIPFTLTVRDFTLSRAHILPFSAGLDLETLLEAYGGTVQGIDPTCYANLTAAINETLNTYYITPLPFETELPLGQVYNLSSYPQVKAHDLQAQTGEPIWWSFTAQDMPPFANPAVIDRPGQDARILPWMAWADEIDGLFYYALTQWGDNPWETPFTNQNANGDGFLFYPPNDATVGYDPCDPNSNRLIPSIRLELLREGLEDYAYLRLLNIQEEIKSTGDLPTAQIISSRTLYNHAPMAYDALRTELSIQIMAIQRVNFIPMFTH